MHIMRLTVLVIAVALPLHGAEVERSVTVDWEGALEEGAIVKIVSAFADSVPAEPPRNLDAGAPGQPGQPVIRYFGPAEAAQGESNSGLTQDADRPQDALGDIPLDELRVYLGDATIFEDCARRVEQGAVRRDGDDVLFVLLLDAFTTNDTVTVYLFVNDSIHAQVVDVYLGDIRLPATQIEGKTEVETDDFEIDQGPPGPPQGVTLYSENELD